MAGVVTLLVSAQVLAQPTTTRVSIAAGGADANGRSGPSSISADGRWVALRAGQPGGA
jgi:hypothetical protein